MKLKTCTCGIECTTENVTLLPYNPEDLGGFLYFNCSCTSTLTINPEHEAFYQLLDLWIFAELAKQIDKEVA